MSKKEKHEFLVKEQSIREFFSKYVVARNNGSTPMYNFAGNDSILLSAEKEYIVRNTLPVKVGDTVVMEMTDKTNNSLMGVNVRIEYLVQEYDSLCYSLVKDFYSVRKTEEGRE